jgi:GTP-binding protein LepA
VVLRYRMPWAEIVSGFYDEVKSATSGYASVDWAPGAHAPVAAVKVDILLNGKALDALCFVAHREKAEAEGRRVAAKLKAVIARQQFEVVVQAAIGGKVFARERIPPFRKDVLRVNGKVMGGGDVTRKQKLLEKQKEGKKRMKTVGRVELSQEAFHSIISSK